MDIHQEQEKIKAQLQYLESNTLQVSDKLKSYRNNAFTKFPLLFVLLSSFGLVSTFYGFEKLIDTIPFLSENPITLLLTGLITLIVTGSLFKKLS